MYAAVAELVDALRSGRSGQRLVGVQVPPAALVQVKCRCPRGAFIVSKTLFCFDYRSMSKKAQSDQITSNKRNPRLLFFMLMGLCILFAISYASRLVENASVQMEIVAIDNSIAQTKKNQAELKAQLDFVQSDAYVEEVARDELGLAKPGDSVVIVLSDTEETNRGENVGGIFKNSELLATTPQVTISVTDLPNWQQWLQLFTRKSSAVFQ